MITNHVKLDSGDIFQERNHKFEVVHELGKGGFAVTYLVNELDINTQKVAKIPVVADDGNNDYRLRKQTHEGVVLNLLKDSNVPNVVKIDRVIDANVQGYDLPVILMEVAPGITCQDYVMDLPDKCIQEDVVKDILIKIGEALIHVHKMGIIHRDVKPDNIFIKDTQNDHLITLIDFGIAAKFDQSKTLNQATSVGTNFYSPPEQQSKGIVSPSADIFGLGATGFFLATGRTLDTMGKYNPKNYPKPGYTISDNFADVIIKATWPDMTQRFPLMDDFVSGVRGYPPIHTIARFIVDGKAFIINKERMMIGRKDALGSQPLDIEISERSQPGEYFISRLHCYIEKGTDQYYRLFDDNSTNGTVWLNQNKEWRRIPDSGLILGDKAVVIGIGFADQPTGKMDSDGNSILPGVYRIIEYRPPDTIKKTS